MAVTEKTGIIVAGTVIVDKINEISAYPKSGELTQIRSIQKAIGGCVPNVALDLKKISPDLPICAVGTIGDDEEGTFVTDTLQQGCVDTAGLTVMQGEKTSFTEVMSVPGGQRTFFTYAGASAKFGSEHVDFVKNCPKILHLGYFLLLERVDNGEGLKILQAAKAHGVETSIDLVSENSDRYALVAPCLPYTDYLIINELEAGKLTGIEPCKDNLEQLARKLKDMGVQKKVIIHMPDCAVCLSDEGCTCVASYQLPDGYIQGTTGAGDAFCAGALIGIYHGWTDREILEFASASAVMALGSPDATSGLKTMDEIRDFCSRFERKHL
ncbi:MAG: carbohydrate kinase family protein [Oscillospiraceae bacterium]|nr:carbohydrate kinase family protein [Oscillospiraceae bacterium]